MKTTVLWEKNAKKIVKTLWFLLDILGGTVREGESEGKKKWSNSTTLVLYPPGQIVDLQFSSNFIFGNLGFDTKVGFDVFMGKHFFRSAVIYDSSLIQEDDLIAVQGSQIQVMD